MLNKRSPRDQRGESEQTRLQAKTTQLSTIERQQSAYRKFREDTPLRAPMIPTSNGCYRVMAAEAAE